eukprot:CAMPEP_0178967436 /NCGR_PEP_ID=MMETSP0789-20121207/17592_1 /TAXON_ID=3005 /ORGANISM="Rhizosolenia setigera, Strain CCMP 1694" /LENGTH=1076 /DNA_ID=CAMNT_0020653043 /DNA_START=415 /DNA_END=3641 /DNA_ORIENTATION=+
MISNYMNEIEILCQDNKAFYDTLNNVILRAFSSSSLDHNSTHDEVDNTEDSEVDSVRSLFQRYHEHYNNKTSSSPLMSHASIIHQHHHKQAVLSSPSSASSYRSFSTSTNNNVTNNKATATKDTKPTTTPSNPSPTSQSLSSPSYSQKAYDIIKKASHAITNFLLSTPGVMWYYLTHPKDFLKKLSQLKESVKKEIHHLWLGSKLLAADVKTAKNLVLRTLEGSPLTRRERKQLVRTTSDLFRLVPMSMFVIIPFMEFALPFALKIFPNMLPSTFQDSLKAEENMKRELKSRIAVASFFQETLHDMAKAQKKRASKQAKETNNNSEEEESAQDFLKFLENSRNGEHMPPSVIIRYAKYFEDDLTLDNMSRMQLINMCKYMGIPPYGADSLLRFQLRHNMRNLKEDDQRILWEGIDSLTKMELREACQERGMRSTGLSKNAYKLALQQWLDLSVIKHVPIALLIMSRTFFLREEMENLSKVGEGGKGESSEAVEASDASLTSIADAISGLEKGVVNEVVLDVAASNPNPDKSNDADLVKLKLEVLEQQNQLIQAEREEKEQKAAKRKREEETSVEEEQQEPISVSSTTASGEDIEEVKKAKSKVSTTSSSPSTTVPLSPAEDKTIFTTDSKTIIDTATTTETIVSSKADDVSLTPTMDAASAINKKEESTIDTSTVTTSKDSIPIQEELKEDGTEDKVDTKDDDKVDDKEDDNDDDDDDEEERELSAEEIEALSQLLSPNAVEKEREELQRIKEAMMKEDDVDQEAASIEDVSDDNLPSDTLADDLMSAPTSIPVGSSTTVSVSFKDDSKSTKETAPSHAITDIDTPIMMSGEDQDKQAAKIISDMDKAADKQATESTTIDLSPHLSSTESTVTEEKESSVSVSATTITDAAAGDDEQEKAAKPFSSGDIVSDVKDTTASPSTITEQDDIDTATKTTEKTEDISPPPQEQDKLDKSITSLKTKLDSMLGKIELQLSEAEEKIGDKLHLLDKDNDGILSNEELAQVLQKVFKREITPEEALGLVEEIDDNQDGILSVTELMSWIEKNKLMKLAEEGRDAEVDDEIQAAKKKREKERIA